jgi:hypothetical protein
VESTPGAAFVDLTRLCRFISTLDAIFANLTRLCPESGSPSEIASPSDAAILSLTHLLWPI